MKTPNTEYDEIKHMKPRDQKSPTLLVTQKLRVISRKTKCDEYKFKKYPKPTLKGSILWGKRKFQFPQPGQAGEPLENG